MLRYGALVAALTLGCDGEQAAIPRCDAGLAPEGMAAVPCGPFVMGSDPGESEALPGRPPDEEPEHIVTLSAYYIDLHEVTNADYRECVTAGACVPPKSSPCPPSCSPNSATRIGYFDDPTYDRFPVLHTDWNMAVAYCAWRDKRLPTEAEWEKAARGGCEIVAPATCGPEDERIYPWGDEEPTCDRANRSDCVGDTDEVGMRPAGDSPYGVHDLAGNVIEWVADWTSDNYSWCADGCTDPTGPTSGLARSVRGGGWLLPNSLVRVSERAHEGVNDGDSLRGFRCARTP